MGEKKKKVMFIFGTRPEAIKVVPVIMKFINDGHFDTKICVTAQHREMLDQVLEIFNIVPDYDLNIMKKNQDLFDITSNIIVKLRDVLKAEQPDLVFVHGDTTTTFVSSLASFYLRIKVAHIEAGLRTYNKYSPFPEEINRTLTGQLADLHLAPTDKSKTNLINEGVSESNILITGNTVIDALFYVRDIVERVEKEFDELNGIDFSKRIVLITGHRRENFGKGFENICEAIGELALKNSDVDFIYPVHLNPNVRKPVFDIIGDIKNIKLIEPLSYMPFVKLMNKSHIILTDSGGIQEEAPSLGKPVLVMRDTTERPEAIDAGTVKLVGTDKNKIVTQVQLLIDSKKEYEKISYAHNPYGDGKASDRILDWVNNYFKEDMG